MKIKLPDYVYVCVWYVDVLKEEKSKTTNADLKKR